VAKNITRFETVAQQTIDQKLIAILQETSLPIRVLCIQVTFGGVGDKMEWDGL
jgi:hypothetical protein